MSGSNSAPPGGAPGSGAQQLLPGHTPATGTPGNPAGIALQCDANRGALVPMRRLTAKQYGNTLADVFEGKLAASTQFPTRTTEISLSGFSTDPDNNTVTQVDADQISQAAEDTAVEVGQRLAEFLPCFPKSANEACAESFITRYGERALRRPVTDDEKTLLLGVFHDASADGFDTGVAAVVQTLLQMPQFLYLVEIGSSDAPAADSVVPLTDYEVATRLSYLFLETMPDDELLAAAAAGQLSTPDAIRMQAERLLADPKAKSALTRFYREWSALRVFAAGEKDATLYPQFDAALAQGMQDSFDRFVFDASVGADTSLASLLTRTDLPIDASLARFYGVAAPSSSDGFGSTTLPKNEAAGILTQPALLAGLAHEAATSPVFRGKFVRTKLLCGELGSPPADAQSRQPQYPPNATERDKAEALLQVPECAGCHTYMNPIGVAFEEFDALGHYRTTYPDGRAVDNSGHIVGAGSLEGDFKGVRELGERLANSAEVQSCMTRQWLRFSVSRKDDDGDACMLQQMQARFSQAGYSLRELMLAVTEAVEFRQRLLAKESP
jgi:hypothetical protein